MSKEDAFGVWLDFSKLGRLSNTDLNAAVDLACSVLLKRPLRSVGVVVCPILVSEKVKNGTRGEIRNFGL